MQEAIKGGLVLVNGKAVTKASSPLKVGDAVAVTLLPSPGLEVWVCESGQGGGSHASREQSWRAGAVS